MQFAIPYEEYRGGEDGRYTREAKPAAPEDGVGEQLPSMKKTMSDERVKDDNKLTQRLWRAEV